MYGSIFSIETLRPELSSSAPMDAEARPLPSAETTPPVTKMYLVGLPSLMIGSSGNHLPARGAGERILLRRGFSTRRHGFAFRRERDAQRGQVFGRVHLDRNGVR